METKDETQKNGKRRRGRKKAPDGRGIPKAALDRLLEEVGGKEALADPAALLRELSAALVSRAADLAATGTPGSPPLGHPDRHDWDTQIAHWDTQIAHWDTQIAHWDT